MIRMKLGDMARSLGLERRSGDVEFEGVGTDSRRIVPGQLFVALKGERFDGHDFVVKVATRGAAAALVERSQDAAIPQVICPNTLIALGQLAALWRSRNSARIVGVTGSNGKTTVKGMLHSILQRRGPCLVNEGNLNNEIGLPLTLCRLGPEHRHAVVEMGCARPGDIRYLTNIARPSIGLVNNAGAAHLEGLGSVEGVARVKGELFESLPANGTAVINADDDFARLWQQMAGSRRIVRFGLDQAADVRGEYHADESGSRLLIRTDIGETELRLPLRGRHNARNALAAAAAALAADCGLDDIAAGLTAFKPVAGRLQQHGLEQWTLIQDTYNANPTSLSAGLQALEEWPGVHWLVLGDMAELGEDAEALHFQAGSEARRLGIQRLFLLGPLSRHAASGFGEGAEHFDSPAELVERFAKVLEPGVVCLIKGSRSMRMEEVAKELLQLTPGGATCS